MLHLENNKVQIGSNTISGNILSYLIWCVRTNGVLRLGVGGVVMANIPASLLENLQ
ncbi:hypothetical protein PGH45_04415 [Legionella pneumophila]|nr:hypothetical protein [Legionella pneumophila]